MPNQTMASKSAKVSRKPPHVPQRYRTIATSHQLPQAFMANKKEERELEKKLIALKTEEEEKLKILTKRQHKVERSGIRQQQAQTKSFHRGSRPKHGDNKWKRNLVLARYPTPPEVCLFNNHTSPDIRRSSYDSHFGCCGSSDSSQEEDIVAATTTATLHPPSPHPHFASSSTNCSPIYRRRTIPTILVTDMDRRRLSPLMLRNEDYLERVQVLSHSMPTLFRDDNSKRSPTLERGNVLNRNPSPSSSSSELDRTRHESGRSSVVKLPPISPHPLTTTCNSAKGKDLEGLRSTLLM